MPVKLTDKQQEAVGGSYALWFVPGAWWIVSLGDDETVIVPEDPPAWPATHPN